MIAARAFWVVFVLQLWCTDSFASELPDITKSPFIKLERGVSNGFIAKMQAKAKQQNITMITNPEFSCLDAGFTRNDVFAEGTMFGTNRPDASLEISGIGDFKAYDYKRYIKGNRECREITYTKQYDPDRFGDQSFAVIMMP